MRKCLIPAILAIVLVAEANSAQNGAKQDAFASYISCHLNEGLEAVETTPLAPGITTRAVQTTRGSRDVAVSEGKRIMFAYPGEDFLANVKVEILPQAGYAESKAALVGNFEYLLASGDNSRNYKLKPKLNGFDIQGLDRSKREGGVLGIYLLFDEATRTVTTIYFLNPEPPKRFKTMEEYGVVRDAFLNSYTGCVRKNLIAHP